VNLSDTLRPLRLKSKSTNRKETPIERFYKANINRQNIMELSYFVINKKPRLLGAKSCLNFHLQLGNYVAADNQFGLLFFQFFTFKDLLIQKN